MAHGRSQVCGGGGIRRQPGVGMNWRAAGLLTVAAATGSCSPTELCHDGIWLEAKPADTTLAVGESFQPIIRLQQCPDPRNVEADLATGDDAVVTVSNGSVRAVGIGHATITASSQGLTAAISVEVVE